MQMTLELVTDPELRRLVEALPKLSPKDRGFAEQLLGRAMNRSLTPKQAPWIGKLIERATNPNPDRAQQLGPGFAGVVELLDRANAKLKWPRLLFRAGAEDYRLTVAGPMARHPGTINVTDTSKGDDGQRPWYGRITREGRFEPRQSLDDEKVRAITEALAFLSKDPAGAAKVYGLETGVCCFCGIELTDKRSISAGYGPICADKWGLPWGIDAA